MSIYPDELTLLWGEVHIAILTRRIGGLNSENFKRLVAFVNNDLLTCI